MVAKCVIGDEFFVFGIVRDGVRPRANQGHIAAQHVQELRQLVQVGAAQQTPKPRHARVAPGGLLDLIAVIHHFHGPKLVDDEPAPVKPVAHLAEDRLPRTVELDRCGDKQRDRREQNQEKSRHGDVEYALGDLLPFGQRRALELDQILAAQGARLSPQILGDVRVRQQVDRGRQYPQIVDEEIDLATFRPRYLQEDTVDVVGTGQRDDLVEGVEKGLAGVDFGEVDLDRAQRQITALFQPLQLRLSRASALGAAWAITIAVCRANSRLRSARLKSGRRGSNRDKASASPARA